MNSYPNPRNIRLQQLIYSHLVCSDKPSGNKTTLLEQFQADSSQTKLKISENCDPIALDDLTMVPIVVLGRL